MCTSVAKASQSCKRCVISVSFCSKATFELLAELMLSLPAAEGVFIDIGNMALLHSDLGRGRAVDGAVCGADADDTRVWSTE